MEVFVLKKVLAAFLAVSLLLLCGCSGLRKEQKYSSVYYDYFDTVTIVTGYEKSRERFAEADALIKNSLEHYHRLFDIYHEYDGLVNLCMLNRLAGFQPVSVDGELMDFLKYCVKAAELTEGNVNIAMGAVLSLWHDARELGLSEPEKAYIPDVLQLKEAAENCDISNLLLDRENGTVSFATDKLKLDVGAIAKGYAVEKTAELLRKSGYSAYLLNVGGTVCSVGAKPDGTSWTAGIQNPFEESADAYCLKLAVTDTALVTSGSYQRFYTVDGVRYHHIIHPETLMPENTYVSVSVLCPDAGMGDALSTALFNMDPERGLELVESLKGVEAVWVAPDGKMSFSSGFEEFIVP